MNGETRAPKGRDSGGAESTGRLRWLLYFLAGCLALVGIVEVALEGRTAFEQWRGAHQVRPYYHWSVFTSDGVRLGPFLGDLRVQMHPSAIYVNAPNQRTAHFTTDGSGFRNGGRLAGAPLVLLFGGSAAFGTGLENDAATLGAHLSSLLRVDVINAAVIGHQSGNELAYLVELLPLRPALVLAFDGWNDYGFHYGKRESPTRLGWGGFDQLEDAMKRGDTRFGSLLPELTRVMARWPPARFAPITLQQVASTYIENVRRMSLVSQALGSKFVCVLQPDRSRSQDYATFRRLVTERVQALDLDGIVPASEFLDEMHTHERGTARLAERIAEHLK